jgi:hypothetical protein
VAGRKVEHVARFGGFLVAGEAEGFHHSVTGGTDGPGSNLIRSRMGLLAALRELADSPSAC